MTSLRSEFLLDPAIVFLNHGSFGATPRPVFESYQRWQLELEREPVDFLGRKATELLRNSRTILADYLGAKADNLVYVTNATTGINIIARSLQLNLGDEVLTTDHEYGAMDRTWRFLSQKRGFKVINYTIPIPLTSKDDFIETFWRQVTPATRVIYLSHITSPTAMILPIETIILRARQAGILTVIDGAHAPGQIPLALDALGADFYVGNLHKWFCAPKGSGFLYVRPSAQNLIEPLIVSWGYDTGNSATSNFVNIVEWNGTRDLACFLAVPDAVQFLKDHDWPSMRAACHSLAQKARQEIMKLSGLPALYPDSPEWYSQMGTAPLPDSADTASLSSRLFQEFKIEIPIVAFGKHKLVRFSLQAYNTEEDVDKLIHALKILLSTKSTPSGV
jgi:isopenicillin-N epimerase